MGSQKRAFQTLNRSVLALTVGLAAYAVVVAFLRQFGDPASLFNLAFYLLLVLNTYFSVSFTEAAFGVRNVTDTAINALLMIGYLAAPWVMGDTMHFYLCIALFFCVAVIKYAVWLRILDAHFFLRRKIIANTCGALLGLLVILTLSGLDRAFDLTAAGVACVLFAVANVWVLLIDPLYREA